MTPATAAHLERAAGRGAEAAAAVAALDAACPWLHLRSGAPDEDGWVRLHDLAGGTGLDVVRRRMAPHTEGIAGVEAAAITTWVGYAVSWLLLGAPYLTGLQMAPSAAQLWLGLHPDDHWVDRLALGTDAAWKPAHGSPADSATAAMPRLVELLTPLVDALAGRRLLGRRALWGSIADAIAYQALNVVDAAGGGEEAGMALADRLLAVLPGRVRPPQWMTVERGPVTHTVRIKQSCCLAYKTQAHGWCTTCPLADDTTRAAAFEDWARGGSVARPAHS